MPTVVLKLSAGQGTETADRQSSDYMLPSSGAVIKTYKLVKQVLGYITWASFTTIRFKFIINLQLE